MTATISAQVSAMAAVEALLGRALTVAEAEVFRASISESHHAVFGVIL